MDRGGGLGDSNLGSKIPSQFNFREFTALANRVIDVGDEDSMDALNDLHNRWKVKFEDDDRPSLKPISYHQLTSYRPPPPPIQHLAHRFSTLPTPDQEEEVLHCIVTSRLPSNWRRRRELTRWTRFLLRWRRCLGFQLNMRRWHIRWGQWIGAQVTWRIHSSNGIIQRWYGKVLDVGRLLRLHTFSDGSHTSIISMNLSALCGRESRMSLRKRTAFTSSNSKLRRSWKKSLKEAHSCFKENISYFNDGNLAWRYEGLNIVASRIGKPLYLDVITKSCTRLNFARVCVMLNISSTLPSILLLWYLRRMGVTLCKVDVEYEWVPQKCVMCMSLGHSMKACPSTKPVLKSPVAPISKNDKSAAIQCPDSGPRKVRETVKEPRKRLGMPSQLLQDDSGKGKELVLYNLFDALMLDEELNEGTSKGHKQSNPPNHDT
ncbi:UNVERIFIED_CONTAM: hypothetical protein Slati_4477900 [Sesamum latifolium]|uniref:Uncharacterized protein n=1 Tax=Sesamum latifolium TaxID=2727402 RepID=A0AAW2SRQ1_9LAMI